MLNELILFAISVIPVVIIGGFIYKKDQDKEPKRILIKLFLGGIGSCILTVIASLIIEIFIPFFSLDASKLDLLSLLIYVFLGIALVEEFCKWIMAYSLSYNDYHFDELYDMIIYCVFVALGFACFENLFYVYQSGITVGIFRALLAVPGHACDGMFMGYYLGLSKISSVNNNQTLKRKNILLSILIPTITHGIYDYCLLTEKIPFIVLFFLFVILMYIFALRRINKVSNLNTKFKYKDKFCPNCGNVVNSNYCPVCGRKNE